MTTRAEIDAELARLEQLIAELARTHEPECVLEAFAAEAEWIEHHKPAELCEYVNESIDRMLARAGLVEAGYEGRSCDQ